MGFGLELKECFEGSYYLLDEPLRERAIRIALLVRLDGLRRFARERRVSAEGMAFVEGLAEGRGEGGAAAGAITMKLFQERRIPYDLTVQGDDGRAYRLRGQRDFFVHDAVDSLTILPLSLYDDGNVEIGRATLRFDPKTEVPKVLRSLRVRRFPPRDA